MLGTNRYVIGDRLARLSRRGVVVQIARGKWVTVPK
jgi:hypothetical protein